nr:MAG TPA: hypothetical protein [Caudoviricetes sp.]
MAEGQCPALQQTEQGRPAVPMERPPVEIRCGGRYRAAL